MPLQPLIVPAQNNSFITAFTLCTLLPTLNDDNNLFGTTKTKLFGNIPDRLTRDLMNELDLAHLNRFPTLIALIQSHLKPRLVRHVNEQQERYQQLFESQELFRARVTLLERADSPSDEFEQTVLSSYFDVKIKMTQGLYPNIENSDLSVPQLYFSIRDGIYHYFVESNLLSESLRRALFPIIPAAFPQEVDLVRFQQAKSKSRLKDMFQEMSDAEYDLKLMSHPEPILLDTEFQRFFVPILVKQSDGYKLWGYKEDKWQFTAVRIDQNLLQKANIRDEDFTSQKTIHVAFSTSMFDVLKEGHTESYLNNISKNAGLIKPEDSALSPCHFAL